MSPITLALILGIAILVLVVLLGVFFFMLRRFSGDEGEEEKKETSATDLEKKIAKAAGGTAKPKKEAPPEPPEKEEEPPSGPSFSEPPPMPVADLPQVEDSGDKIRILIVDDNPGTRDNVSRLLYFEEDMQVIGQGINGRQGLEMAIKMKPHIVLMDINMPDMDGIEATELMSVDAPYSQVIIMSVQSERHYMKRAMAAGARDFQPKPFTSEELVNCIRRVYDIGRPTYRQLEALEESEAQKATQGFSEMEISETDAPVIVVYSAKGGIGTSAVAVNLAVALQRELGEVALMDGELQFGDVFVHINIQPTRTMADMVHDNELDVELLPEVLLAHNSGLKVLLGPPKPEIAEMILPEMLTEIIKGLKAQFKAVVVDTGSQFNAETKAILEVADYVLVITTPELPAIKSAKMLLESKLLKLPPHRIEVVMNRSTLPGGIAPKKIEKALNLTHSYHIPYDPRMHAAINKGVSIIQQDAGAPSARAIAQMAKGLWSKIAQNGTEKAEESA